MRWITSLCVCVGHSDVISCFCARDIVLWILMTCSCVCFGQCGVINHVCGGVLAAGSGESWVVEFVRRSEGFRYVDQIGTCRVWGLVELNRCVVL